MHGGVLELCPVPKPVITCSKQLGQCRVLCCRDCQAKIANQKDVFSMSLEGPQGTYVNPGGYVHETITLHKAKGVRVLNQAPSTEYTWFPGGKVSDFCAGGPRVQSSVSEQIYLIAKPFLHL
ncbi:unnamed protein product [Timema podura]|uniref:CULT domain-containing protein n=1 Tax=Timema podura TaxID=61482 RepID=A0ABN7NFS4_TIMPD|nr:unnamed protein product [Timema podura]